VGEDPLTGSRGAGASSTLAVDRACGAPLPPADFARSAAAAPNSYDVTAVPVSPGSYFDGGSEMEKVPAATGAGEGSNAAPDAATPPPNEDGVVPSDGPDDSSVMSTGFLRADQVNVASMGPYKFNA
jgi:hypothetical protein